MVVRKIMLDRADRMQRIPEEFGNLDRLAARIKSSQTPVIDLSLIDCSVLPDIDLPVISGEDVFGAAGEHEYQQFVRGIAQLYRQFYGITLDPDREVLPVTGSAVGLILLGLAYVDPGEMVLVPDPCPPTYRSAAALCGGGIQTYILHDRHHYLPDTHAIENSLVGKTKLWILGYPQNPSTALADRDAITEIVNLGRKHNILIVYDNSFSFLTNSQSPVHGFLGHPRARATGVEVFSLDRTFGLDALRLAVVVGNREAVAGISNLAQGAGLLPGRAALKVGLAVIEQAETILAVRRDVFAQARALLEDACAQVGWQTRAVDGVPYCWVAIPRRYSSLGFARRLLRRTGIKVAPGTIFGERGEGYVRIALAADLAVMRSACEKLTSFGRLGPRRHRSANQ